jgi:addiction module HigA family antidote
MRKSLRKTPTTHPGETLQETLDAKGWTQTRLAREIGRPIKTINEVIKGKSRITERMALQLEEALGIPAEFWLTMQMNYNLEKAREEIALLFTD